jgi:hypothetical protein
MDTLFIIGTALKALAIVTGVTFTLRYVISDKIKALKYFSITVGSLIFLTVIEFLVVHLIAYPK